MCLYPHRELWHPLAWRWRWRPSTWEGRCNSPLVRSAGSVEACESAGNGRFPHLGARPAGRLVPPGGDKRGRRGRPQQRPLRSGAVRARRTGERQSRPSPHRRGNAGAGRRFGPSGRVRGRLKGRPRAAWAVLTVGPHVYPSEDMSRARELYRGGAHSKGDLGKRSVNRARRHRCLCGRRRRLLRHRDVGGPVRHCKVCRARISAERLQLQPRALCCSQRCTALNRQELRRQAVARHRARVRADRD